MNKIIEDINERGLKPIVFICETEDGGLQMVSYNNRGLVTYISDVFYNKLNINESLEGAMVRPIISVGYKNE